MTRDYRLSLSTPNSNCDVSADNMDGLANAIPKSLYENLSDLINPDSNFRINRKATLLLRIRNSTKKRVRSAPLRKAGLELHLARCYVQGLAIVQAIKWLKKEKGYSYSRTAMGRYWSDFAKINIAE